VKLVVGPVVFCTIVLGIAGMRDLRAAGRVGLKALVYFEVVTTAALALGCSWPTSRGRARASTRRACRAPT
jgi:Na+/H+-dicarboxylate symporter